MTGLWFLAKFLRYAFPPLFEPPQGFYGISNGALGLAFTGFMMCYAAMQFPSGVLGDRIGGLRVMAAGGMLAGIAAITLIVEAGFALLVLGMLLIGAGTGLHKTVSVTLLARSYPSHTGRAFGIHETFGAAAGIAAPIAAIGFLAWRGWRTLFLVAGIVALCLAAMAAIRIPRRLDRLDAVRSSRPNPSLRRYLDMFRDRQFTLFVLITVLFAFAYNGVVAFLPLYLVDVGRLPVATAGLLYSVLFVASVGPARDGRARRSDGSYTRAGRLHRDRDGRPRGVAGNDRADRTDYRGRGVRHRRAWIPAGPVRVHDVDRTDGRRWRWYRPDAHHVDGRWCALSGDSRYHGGRLGVPACVRPSGALARIGAGACGRVGRVPISLLPV